MYLFICLWLVATENASSDIRCWSWWGQLICVHSASAQCVAAHFSPLRSSRCCGAAARHSAAGTWVPTRGGRWSVRGWCAVHAAILRSREAVENTDIMGVERRPEWTLHLVFADDQISIIMGIALQTALERNLRHSKCTMKLYQTNK